MRNTTKLKTLLKIYTVSFDMDEDGIMILVLMNKTTNEMEQFEAESYSRVLAKAYSFMLKELRRKEKELKLN